MTVRWEINPLVCVFNCACYELQYELRVNASTPSLHVFGPPGALNPRCSSLQSRSDVQHAKASSALPMH